MWHCRELSKVRKCNLDDIIISLNNVFLNTQKAFYEDSHFHLVHVTEHINLAVCGIATVNATVLLYTAPHG